MPSFLRKSIAGGAVMVAAAAGVLLTAPAASAGDGACPSGQVCLFRFSQYDGGRWGSASDVNQYNTVVYDGTNINGGDSASAINNNATRCTLRAFKDSFQSGASFNLSYPARGGTWRDPNLSNGAGDKPGTNFDDSLSSHDFCPA
ncbi:peptidase inhibitor family I36 protein [Kineococcus endophyticus]|uniref:Peptidase inhibitor family I36 protein n=1 Tax=Kineococcus endophyticus TaxID=1181883 RepID=A0ABV3PD03_9ACTN